MSNWTHWYFGSNSHDQGGANHMSTRPTRYSASGSSRSSRLRLRRAGATRTALPVPRQRPAATAAAPTTAGGSTATTAASATSRAGDDGAPATTAIRRPQRAESDVHRSAGEDHHDLPDGHDRSQLPQGLAGVRAGVRGVNERGDQRSRADRRLLQREQQRRRPQPARPRRRSGEQVRRRRRHVTRQTGTMAIYEKANMPVIGLLGVGPWTSRRRRPASC